MELAGDASGAAIKSLLTKLGSLLAQEYALISGVRGDVQFINDELASMLAFLSNLQHSNEGHDEQTEDWMKQVREVAYDIEDCIDDFTHSLDPDRRGDDCWSKLLRALYEIRTCWPRRNIAAKIAQLKERARDVGERRGRYGVSNPVPAGKGIKNTMTMVGHGHGHYPADHQEVARRLVSIDKPVGVSDMHSLETWITSDENKKLGVLSIFGFGGVGKTTAAMALYRSCGVKFMRRAMVTVSHSTDPDEVLKDILKQLKESTMKHQGPINSTGSSSASQKKNLVATAAAAPRRMMSELQSLFQDRQQEVISSVNISSQEKIHGAPVPQSMMNFFHKHMGNLLSTIRLCSCGQHEDGRVAKEHEAIKMELRDKLEKDRYLLLIDDVWSASTWQMIWNCLPTNDNGSRVIVTTRFAAVANTPLVEYHHQHKMQLLSEQEAEKLFNKSLSECGVTEGSQPTQKDQIPSRVWEMCGGLPLPIVTMAGLVASKPLTQKNEWTEVCNSLFPRSQVCQKPEEFMRIINYCYNVLPSDLKTCSLYLCIFPKGGKISRKRLIRRWIAEGFVSERQGLSVEDIAETCFNQLVERKIIRAVEHSSDGRVKSCQVHDMVLEFIISKASEENFVTVVGGQWSMPTRSSKVRRLSVHSADSKHVKEADRMNLSHVRSLTVFGSLDHLHLKSFKAGIVQVLDLERCTGFKAKHDNVSDICEMTLLKFLSLRRTDVRELPSNIGSLKYLETLDVRETKVRVLPASVGQLERISNILGGDKGTREALKVPREIKRTAKTLRVLSGIEIGNESSIAASDISYFTGLRKLAIYKLYKTTDQMFKDLLSSIQYLSGYYLQTLVIDDDSSDFFNTLNDMSRPTDLRSLELSGRLLKLPEWVPFLNNLIKLTLSATVLRPDNLELLSRLRILFSLTFSICKTKHDPGIASILEKNTSDYRGEIFVPAGGFVNLKLLRIFIPLLPSLNFSEGAMPALERLELHFRRLEGLNGMAKLQSIHDVIITVDGKAGGVTKSILDDLKRPQSKYALNINELYD